jgi:hypothetical protein
MTMDKFPPVKSVSTASNVAAIFSATIKFASSPASLPPRVSFVSRKPMTLVDSMTNIADEYQGNMSSPLAGHAAWKQQHAQPMVPTSDVSAAILIGMRCVEARMFTAR